MLCLDVQRMLGTEFVASNSTELLLKNSSNQDVRVFLTLGSVPGCVASIQDIPFVTHVLSDLQGWFVLPRHVPVSYAPPEGIGLNGNFAFGTAPSNCPPSDFPNGVNLAEFMLNNGFQGEGAQETIDISAVAGVNAYLRFLLSGGGPWNAGSVQQVTRFENKKSDTTLGRSGCSLTPAISAQPARIHPSAPTRPSMLPIRRFLRVRPFATYSGTRRCRVGLSKCNLADLCEVLAYQQPEKSANTSPRLGLSWSVTFRTANGCRSTSGRKRVFGVFANYQRLGGCIGPKIWPS